MNATRKRDLDLRASAEAELEASLGQAAESIGVSVADGVVSLSGQVRSFVDSWNAERSITRLSGVRGFVNNLTVHPVTSYSDVDLASLAVHALAADSTVKADSVIVRVSDGVITLRGEVPTDRERRAADRAVRALSGVRGVTNLIGVHPPADARVLQAKIEAAFERQAMIDAKSITVSVDDHTVSLTGRVHSWAERDEAERTAAASVGVAEVRNQLTVIEQD